jgi:hypothetical protein
MKKSILNFISAMLICGASSNVNASLASNAVLDFNDGVYSCLGGFGTAPDNCTYGTTVNDNAGSYWAFDASGDGVYQQAESIAISSAGTGLTLGSEQRHPGNAGDWLLLFALITLLYLRTRKTQLY